MLCPNAIDVSDDIASAFNTIIKIDALAYASMNTLIGVLSPDPSWLSKIRIRMAMLSDTGALWQQQKPNIWSEILQPFNSYYALFSGFAEAADGLGDDTDSWVALLTQLKERLADAVTSVESAESAFQEQVDNLQNIEKLLSDQLDEAWSQLASEEQEMVNLATKIGSLQDQLDDLESSLNSTEISDGASFIKSTVTITYKVLSEAGESVPYLTIAGLLYTVGDLAYNMIVTDSEITDTINQIVELRNEATSEAQAAAMTKAVIQLINSFDKKLIAVQGQMPAFSEMWSAEKEKIEQVIDALQAGAAPSEMISLVAMSAAEGTWRQFSDLVTKVTEAVESGGSVNIITSENSEEAVQQG